MADFEVTFEDAHRFAAVMARASSLVITEMEHTVDRLTLVGESQAKKKVPVDTGHLRRSIASRPATNAGGVVTGSWGTATIYAKQVEFGGTIRARNAPYLVFMGKDGHLVSVKSVTQSGTPYMMPSKTHVERLMPGEFKRMMQRILGMIGGL